MRNILFILTFSVLCTNVFAQANESLENSSKEKVKFSEPDYDTTRNVHEIEIESEKYFLEIYFYSLNDSLLPVSVTYTDHLTDEIIDSYVLMTHNNQGKIILKQGDSVLFSEIVDKTIPRDSVPKSFYEVFTIWKLKFERIENNKIHFSSFLGDSDGDVGFFVNYMIGLDDKIIEFYFPDEFEEEF